LNHRDRGFRFGRSERFGSTDRRERCDIALRRDRKERLLDEYLGTHTLASGVQPG
jgi:hypothetical protein